MTDANPVQTTIVVDSIEAALIRIELADGTHIDLPTDWLPSGVAEGDHIRVEAAAGSVTFAIDRDATESKRTRNQARLDAITDEPPEDFKL